MNVSETGRLCSIFPGLALHLGRVPQDAGLLEELVDRGFGDSIAASLDPSAPEMVFSRLFSDLATVDFDWLERLSGEVRALDGSVPVIPDLEPFGFSEFDGLDSDRMALSGRQSLAAGRWGVVIFAGGAATRFWAGAGSHPQAAGVLARHGGSAPKGLFPLGSVSGRSFLDLFAGQMAAAAAVTGRQAPLVLMAGRATRAALQEWVDSSLPAGLDRDMVRVMVQAEHPRLDMQGRLLMRPDGSLIFTGDGHGGVFRAMSRVGGDGQNTTDWLRSFGVTDVVMHNVDNVAANPLEPARLGFHVEGGFEMTLSAVERVDPMEKVGIIAFNRGTGRVDVVEYSVCPRETALARDGDGRLRFVPAHINTNLVSLDAIRPDLVPTLYPGKVVDAGGKMVPACSHEMLNQSLASLLEPAKVGVIVLPRSDFFQPTKSLDGVDSLVTTREWLAARGWN